MNKKGLSAVITMAVFALVMGLLYKIYSIYPLLERQALTGIDDVGRVSFFMAPADENKGIAVDLKSFASPKGFLFFMPVRAELSGLVFYAMDEDGRPLERFEMDMSSGGCVIGDSLSVRVMQSDLPSVEIRTVDEKLTLSDIESSKDHSLWIGGDMTISCSDSVAAALGCEGIMRLSDRDMERGGSISLRGHGNASWLLDKKSYNISSEARESILGMDMSDSYVLLANAIDYSLVRNETFFELAEKCGLRFTPQARQVDLFVDGDYRGCYLLSTRIKSGEGSVDITPGADYLYRWGMPDEDSRQLELGAFRDEDTDVVEIRDMDDEAAMDKAFVIARNTMSAVMDTDSEDYLEYVDEDSWARYYWLQEYAKNTDATSRSLYTIWDHRAQRMLMCPVWDMDQTAGVEEPFGRSVDYLYPTGWAVREEEWYVPLFEHSSFMDKVREVYFEGGVREALMEGSAIADRCSGAVQKSAEMNFIRWPVLDKEQNNQIVRYMGSSTIETQREWLREWLRQRFEWIDEEMGAGQ